MSRVLIRCFVNYSEVNFTKEELFKLKDEIEELFYPTYHSRRHFVMRGRYVYYLDDGYMATIPSEWLRKTIEFGWKRTRKELQLIGDKIPLKDNVFVQFELD